VGELDEEMVYESRPGETFVLGASTWRIDQITHDRMVVLPAPGEPAKLPFWHGDSRGRPLELGRALGATVRELRAAPRDDAVRRLADDFCLGPLAATNLLRFLDEQAEATGACPDDRLAVVERFRDEIGDWRVCVLTPLGARVHAPWALAVEDVLVDPEALARFLPAWQGVGERRHGPAALLDALEQLQGTPIPASSLEADVLAARVAGDRPKMLDELRGTRRPRPGGSAPPRPSRSARSMVSRRPSRPAREPDGARTRTRCSRGTVSSPARRPAPRGAPAATPPCIPCCAPSRSPARLAAASSSPARRRAVRVARCGRPPPRPARRGSRVGRDHAGRHRSHTALRCRTPLARPSRRARSTRASGRGLRGARRRALCGLPETSRAHVADVRVPGPQGRRAQPAHRGRAAVSHRARADRRSRRPGVPGSRRPAHGGVP